MACGKCELKENYQRGTCAADQLRLAPARLGAWHCHCMAACGRDQNVINALACAAGACESKRDSKRQRESEGYTKHYGHCN